MNRLVQRRKLRLLVEELEPRNLLSAGALSGAGKPIVSIRLEVVGTDGTPIDTLHVGEEFQLRAWVQDLRDASIARGVAAAYLDVFFSHFLVGFTGDRPAASFSELFEHCTSFESAPGQIQEAGGYAGFNKTAGAERLLWSVSLRAEQAGLAKFVADRPDDLHGHDVLVFGLDFDVTDSTEFHGTQVQVLTSDGSVPEQNEFPVEIPNETPPVVEPPVNELPADPLPNEPPVVPLPDPPAPPPEEDLPPIDVPPIEEPPIDPPPFDPLPGDPTYEVHADSAVASVRLEIVAADGSPIDTLRAGQEFQLRAWVKDLRHGAAASGVAAAYLDVFFSQQLVGFAGEEPAVTFGEQFEWAQSFTASPGQIQESGGFAGFNETAGAERMLWSVVLRAEQPGLAKFVANTPDDLPRSSVLAFGIDFDVTGRTEFHGTEVQILTAGGTLPEQNDFPVETVVETPPPVVRPPVIDRPAVALPDSPPNVPPVVWWPVIDVSPGDPPPVFIDDVVLQYDRITSTTGASRHPSPAGPLTAAFDRARLYSNAAMNFSADSLQRSTARLAIAGTLQLSGANKPPAVTLALPQDSGSAASLPARTAGSSISAVAARRSSPDSQPPASAPPLRSASEAAARVSVRAAGDTIAGFTNGKQKPSRRTLDGSGVDAAMESLDAGQLLALR